MADLQQSVVEFWRRWLAASLECPTCGSSREYRLLVGFDWRDLDALEHVRDQHPRIACAVCGALMESPFPVVQYRPTDVVRVLVVMPVADAPRVDGLSESLTSLSNDDDLNVGPLSTVPAPLGHRLLTMYTGLLVSSLEPVAVDDDEMRSWLVALKAEAELPDVARIVAAFVSENDQAAAAESLLGNLEVLDDRWRPVRRRLAEKWRAEVTDDDELRVLNSRLRRLDQWVLFDGAPPVDQSSLPAKVTAAVDDAIAVDPLDDSGLRRDRLLAALTEVRSSASPTLLIGALNSTVAALLSMPSRTSADLAHAVELADELVAVSSNTLGPRHRLTRRARNDRLVALIDRDVLAPAVVGSLVELAQECVDEQDALVSDVLLNLAVALGESTVVMSADEQMLSVRLFRLCGHLLALHEPDDLATRIRVLNNMAAALRRSPLGRTRSNRDEAIEAYSDAVRLDDSAHVLATAGRTQLDANLLNVWVESNLEQEMTSDVVSSVTTALDEFAGRTRATFDHDHPTRWRTMLNLSTLAVEAYDATFRADSAHTELLERGRSWAREEQDRCAMVALRWALLNAEGVACARPVLAGGVLDEIRARAAFQAVLDESGLPADAAIRRVVAHNLGQLHLGAGDWDRARIAYGEAAAAADVVIRRATSLNGRIADIENASDITLLHALCCLHVERVGEAIAAIEGGRQRLTSEDREDDDLAPLFTADQAVVWVMTSTLGSALIATSEATVGVVHIQSLNSRQLMPLIHELQAARSFDDANKAIGRIGDALNPLLAPLSEFLETCEARTINIVAAGALSHVPLHALPVGTAEAIVQKRSVRFLPTARMAARLRRRAGRAGHSSVLANPDGTLAAAATEVALLEAFDETTAQPPRDASLQRWLADTLPTTRHLHLACHATVGLTPATTRLELGGERPLTLADLIELTLPNLDSVVAAACNTAVSGGAAPDELLGLAYGFLAAGAAEVVASLWHIDDEMTALLVARLYREWRSLELADSLAAAQRWMSNLTNDELRQLVHDDPDWLPPGLQRLWIPRLLAPRHRVGSQRPFASPAYWAGLIYVGR